VILGPVLQGLADNQIFVGCVLKYVVYALPAAHAHTCNLSLHASAKENHDAGKTEETKKTDRSEMKEAPSHPIPGVSPNP
jgi:hypothetical protein